MENLSNFAERLEMCMTEKNVDAPQLAALLDVDSTTVYNYLRKKYLPSLKHLIFLADYFNCTADFLLGLEDENQSKVFYKCPAFPEQLKFLKSEIKCPWRYIYIKSEIPESTFYNWKDGKFDPNIIGILSLAKGLECPVDVIIGRARCWRFNLK